MDMKEFLVERFKKHPPQVEAIRSTLRCGGRDIEKGDVMPLLEFVGEGYFARVLWDDKDGFGPSPALVRAKRVRLVS